jgi:predicted rRNA pseudouridine synthase
MNGILILDKPAGITSHDACDEVKKILNLKKAGHAGTLDPMVTGVLVIALEDSVKILRFLSGLPKEYNGMAKTHKEISRNLLEMAIKKKFLGKIKQIPPKRSRVKRQEREREIYEFKILDYDKRNFSFFVSCEAGTYIRKLIDDLGKEIGIGMHMSSLRRVKQGPFSEQDSIKLDELVNKNKLKKSLFSVEEGIKKLGIKTIKLNEKEEQDLRFGKYLDLDFDIKDNEIFIALNKDDKVIGIVKKQDNKIKPERII